MSLMQLAGCAIIDEYDRILLLHRVKTDWYELPGGKYDPTLDKTFEDTAKRELLEELLCNVRIEKKIGETGFTENGDILLYHWYHATLLGTPMIGEDKFDKFEYLSLNDLHNYNLSPNMEKFYQAWIEGDIKIKDIT